MNIKILPSLIILMLVTIGIFGFLSMGTMNMDNPYPCPFSVISNCSTSNDPLMALHHMSGIGYFSQVILDINFGSFVFFATILFLSVLLTVFVKNSLYDILIIQKIHKAKIKSKYKKSFLRWLSKIRSNFLILINRVFIVTN